MTDEDRVREIFEAAQKLQSLVNDAELNGVSVILRVLSYPTLNGKTNTMITVEASKRINVPYTASYSGGY